MIRQTIIKIKRSFIDEGILYPCLGGLVLVIIAMSFYFSMYLVVPFEKCSISRVLFSIAALILGSLVVKLQQRSRDQITSKQETIDLLREQRHDVINDLTLALSYIQLDEIDQAANCLQMLAASLSDKYNYSSVPADAWYTVARNKRKVAESLGIRFKEHITAPLPQDIHQRRLMPKLIGNLLDNAIDAVHNQSDAWIEVIWCDTEDRQFLSVGNSGVSLSATALSNIRAGFSTKGEGRGYGLAICQDIAQELGAELLVESGDNATTFSLVLWKNIFLGIQHSK